MTQDSEQEIMHGDEAKAPPVPTLSDNPPPGGAEGYYTPEDTQAQPAQAQPTHESGSGSGSGSGGGPQPPTPYTPEIHDGQGNPSKGFISALTSGLHWLAQNLGLVGGAQAAAPPAIASSPQQQQSQQQFVQGNMPDGTPAMTKDQWNELTRQIDPDHSFAPYVRNVAAFEYAYKMLIYQGCEPEAGQDGGDDAALFRSVSSSKAMPKWQPSLQDDGHAKEAVDQINEASDARVDGRHIVASLGKDGQVQVTGKDSHWT